MSTLAQLLGWFFDEGIAGRANDIGCVDVGDGGEFRGEIDFGETKCGDDGDCFNVGDKFCGESDGWYDVCLDGGGGGGGGDI